MPKPLTPIVSVAAAFFSSRLLCSAFVYWGHCRRPYLEPVAGGWEGVANWWLNPWTTYDSQWYLQIATNSYDVNTTAFFPLYPWLLSLAGSDPVRLALWGTSLSLLSLWAALWLVFRLTELEWGATKAHATIWLMAYTPAAPFFGAVYTESLFLALLAATFLAIRHKRWWIAGLLGALAALLRNPGFLIAGALLIEAWGARREPRESSLKWLVWTLPLGAFLSVQLYFAYRFGSPLAGVSSQSFYHRAIDWPWNGLINDFKILVTNERGLIFNLVTGTSLFASLTGLYLALFTWGRFKGGYLLLIGGITLMNLCMLRQLPPQTISATRYMGGLFPFSQVLAWYLVERLGSWPRARMCLVGLQFYLFLMFSYMFGFKQFLG